MKILIEAKVLGVGSNAGEDKAVYPYVVMLESSMTVDGQSFPDTLKTKSAIKPDLGLGLFEVKLSTYERTIYYKIVAQLQTGKKGS